MQALAVALRAREQAGSCGACQALLAHCEAAGVRAEALQRAMKRRAPHLAAAPGVAALLRAVGTMQTVCADILDDSGALHGVQCSTRRWH